MYRREITRSHRMAFIIAIDQSSSMSQRLTFSSRQCTKAEAVSIITARLIDELIARARRDDQVRNYYDVALLGYSGDRVYSLLGEKIEFMPVTMLAERRPTEELFSSERVLPSGECRIFTERVAMWVPPKAGGSTPMYELLLCVTDMVERWCREPQNRQSFPPIIFNITDGEATDATPEMVLQAAENLKAVATEEGNVLLVNIHLSSEPSVKAMLFPSPDELSEEDAVACRLAKMSSVVPEVMHKAVREFRADGSCPPYVMMSYNASITQAVAMLNIGSRSLIKQK